MSEEEQIQKGFNAGYQLQQHDTKFSRTLQSAFKDKEEPYAKGFIAGAQEFEQEREIDNSLLSKHMDKEDKIKDEPSNEKDNEMDFER